MLLLAIAVLYLASANTGRRGAAAKPNITVPLYASTTPCLANTIPCHMAHNATYAVPYIV